MQPDLVERTLRIRPAGKPGPFSLLHQVLLPNCPPKGQARPEDLETVAGLQAPPGLPTISLSLQLWPPERGGLHGGRSGEPMPWEHSLALLMTFMFVSRPS